MCQAGGQTSGYPESWACNARQLLASSGLNDRPSGPLGSGFSLSRLSPYPCALTILSRYARFVKIPAYLRPARLRLAACQTQLPSCPRPAAGLRAFRATDAATVNKNTNKSSRSVVHVQSGNQHNKSRPAQIPISASFVCHRSFSFAGYQIFEGKSVRNDVRERRAARRLTARRHCGPCTAAQRPAPRSRSVCESLTCGGDSPLGRAGFHYHEVWIEDGPGLPGVWECDNLVGLDRSSLACPKRAEGSRGCGLCRRYGPCGGSGHGTAGLRAAR